jgi:phosphatidylglycerophosphate synthase
MFDQRLRRTKEQLVGPLASRMGRVVPPGVLTGAAFALTVVAAGAAWAGVVWLAVGAWLVSRLLDGLDGAVARARDAVTDLGGYLDMVLDTVGYALAPLGVALWLDTRAGWIALAVMLAAFYVNTISWAYLSALAEKRARGVGHTGELTSVTMAPALVEGAETIVVFTVFLAFPSAAPLIFSAMAAAVLIGVGQRGVWAWRHL